MRKFFKKLLFAVQSNTRAAGVVFLFIFSFGLLIGFSIEWYMTTTREADAVFGFRKIHPINNRFQFINPLIGFDISEKRYSEYTGLKNQIENYINSPEVSGKINSISVYFRNLETGDWVGINQNEDYDPASLLKVPIMMFYLKLAESDEYILSRTYAYTKSDINLLKSVQGGDLSTRLIEGKQYTVEELIYEMIVRSDNIAKYLLILNSSQGNFNEIYGDLGIQIHKEGNVYTISSKIYSLFFRTLYNATFLNQEMSEKALKILSEAEFKNGLVAGVAPDIRVAHKFGQYASITNGKVTSVEAHDCGIIYYPDSPYALCVMTRGHNTGQLEGIIQQISQVTYHFIQEQKTK